MIKLSNFLDKHSSKLTWIFIVVYAIIFSFISIWKYSKFLYNGLDLAIINNVFYNTINSNWFWSSIQNHSYLGDHFTPILILLLPLYYLFQSAETLLILQSFFLALTAWPIYLIANLILKNNKLALGLSTLWLINPLVHNINLFEFHFISLAPFFILMVFYYYQKLKLNIDKKNIFYFVIFILLSLAIREDISFIILTMLLVMLFSNLKNKKLIKIFLSNIIISTIWLGLSIKIINFYSISDFSPFIYYYSWLQNSNMLFIWQHVVSLSNIEMIIGFLLPFLFIPVIKPKWILITLIPFLQIIFSATGGGALIWKMHYASLFLPGIVISFIYGFKDTNNYIENKIQSKFLLLILLITINLYLWVDMGPLAFKKINKYSPSAIKIVNSIPQDKTVLTGYSFLANLSNRNNIYALNYYFLGTQQFGKKEYIIEEEPDYILIDSQDFIDFDIQLRNLKWSKNYFKQGDNRMRELLKDYGVVAATDDIILLKKDYPKKLTIYSRAFLGVKDLNTDIRLNNKIKLNNYNLELIDKALQINLTFQAIEKIDNDYQLEITIIDKEGEYKKIVPMAYGLYPTSEWGLNEKIIVNYWFNIPSKIDLLSSKIYLKLITLKGGVEIGKIGWTQRVIDKKIISGNPIELDWKK